MKLIKIEIPESWNNDEKFNFKSVSSFFIVKILNNNPDMLDFYRRHIRIVLSPQITPFVNIIRSSFLPL